MQICPYCASENIYYSKKNSCYFCEDCERKFDRPSMESGSRIFISYGHDENQVLVNLIKDYLVKNGYDVWIDSSNIQKGRDWRERITDGIMASNGVLAFLSKHSVRDPGVCLDELRIAFRLKHAYIKTVLVESSKDVNPPYRLTEIQWVNMEDWRSIPEKQWDEYFQSKMKDLLKAIESEESKEFEKQMRYISQTLSVFDPIAKEQLLLREEFIGRRWLAELVQNWLEHDNNNRMMIYGVPGAGKSAFAANFSRFNYDVVAELYFSWDSSIFADTDKVICQLAFKLAMGLKDYRRMLTELLRKDTEDKQKTMKSLHGSALFDWMILNPITCCINGNRGRSLIIIDGLDEVSEETGQLLFKKSALFPEWIRVLFTSRYNEATQGIYSSARTIMLDSNEERNTEDILEYVSNKLGVSAGSNEIRLIKERICGIFMYAKTLCNAILDGQISMNNLSSLPVGLNEFYIDFLKRLFPVYEDFVRVRPLFELICVEEVLYEPIVRLTLGIDKYTLFEMRMMLKSLIISEKGKDGKKTLRFVHKSIYDWIQCRELAGDYYVNVKNGYLRLAESSEQIKTIRDSVKSLASETGNDISEINLQIDQLWNLYPCWLVKSGQFEKYRAMLLNSFDSDTRKEVLGSYKDYTVYYKFYSLWRWADLFPMNEGLEDLRGKLKEIVRYPVSLMCSRLAHCSFQISALLLKELMLTGRFSDVFFSFIEQLNFSGYFMSSASDMDGETRDGWDKYYMTRDVVICLKELDRLSVPVPSSVRSQCERMKLTYSFYFGRYSDGMFSGMENNQWGYGILCEKELYKDICEYEPENELMRELKTNYNTKSLLYYFINGDDEDESFVQKCITHSADIALAYDYAKKYISSDTMLRRRASTEMNARLAYIQRTVERSMKGSI